MTSINPFLTSCGFLPVYHVEGREAIANLFAAGKRCGIYVLHFADGRYYVGQSVDVTRRYVEHRKNHVDIVKLSFQEIAQAQLTSVETMVMHLLKDQGFSLRNIRGIDPPPGLADFDLIMAQSAQEQWLTDTAYTDFSGSRIIDPELRSKYHGKYRRFLNMPHAQDVIDVLQEYIATAIPRVRASEVSFWSCSCLPEPHVYARININWQEVFTAFISQNELLFSFHSGLSPLDVGDSLSTFFRRFPRLEFDITVDEEDQYLFNVRGREEDIQTYFTQKNLELSDELDALLCGIFDTIPNLTISSHHYKPGSDDQVNLVVLGKDAALRLLQDEAMSLAIRLLNLRLMRKGASPYRSSHCLDLADTFIEGQ
jgi:hypothetical protein